MGVIIFMDDKLSKFLQIEIDQINAHLPSKPVKLSVLDGYEIQGYQSRDGNFTHFAKNEITHIKNMIPKNFWKHVQLPIIILRRRDLGTGVFTIGGTEENSYVIEKILDDNLSNYLIWKNSETNQKILYRPDIIIIRKFLPTTTVLGFS